MKNAFIAAVLLNCSILCAQYNGTGSVTQGIGIVSNPNIFGCPGGRIPSIGTIIATDNSIWTVPAVVNFNSSTFPFASDLHNPCTGMTYSTSNEALNALNGTDIITIDPTGEIITAFIFSDNYFEMYINGIPVGKDNVPYTQFNSNIIRFKVSRPFSIAIKLVDWEENLGIGTENNNGFSHHIGDGGMVAVFKDENNQTVALTGPNWKAQTFYSSPIKDLNCPSENGTLRLSTDCSTTDSQDGSNYYGLHWNIPSNWMNELFDDSSWPFASVYSNAEIGVDNKPAYTNFTNIFDDPTLNAQFIWSTNIYLDNEVIVRFTVDQSSGSFQNEMLYHSILITPNPSHEEITVEIFGYVQSEVQIAIFDIHGNNVFPNTSYVNPINISSFPKGIYLMQVEIKGLLSFQRFIVD